ncbi:MAG: hypothetical protein E7632_04360 [Ruminococcaceae bacterium]|nr:hypothetical protein [Oscillospiraceae bacterium]
MTRFLARLREGLSRFFWGRYGADALSWALVIASMVLTLLASIFDSGILMLVSYIPLIFALMRMLSRNIPARAKENQKFLGIWKPVKKWFRLQYNRIRDIRTHRYFSCPTCKNNLRVPKGRGEITITCPVCKTRFDRKS